MNDFKDLFSRQSRVYATSRPKYPEELYQFLNKECLEHELAWDCATGNGQAAIALARYFDNVIATDASENQINNATAHSKVRYSVASAYDSGIKPNSIDLITVATAAHWFDPDSFYKEADRVLKPGGLIAIWAYWDFKINEKIDSLTSLLVNEILKDYWAPEIQLVKGHYENLPFPYKEIKVPKFYSIEHWDLNQLLGYFQSWSGTQTYILKNNQNPTDLIYDELKNVWGNENDIKEVKWELFMKVGRK